MVRARLLVGLALVSGLLLIGCHSRGGDTVASGTGVPMTLGELNDWYPAVPDAENAAPIFSRAASAYKDPGDLAVASLPMVGDADLPTPNVPLPDAMYAAVGQFLTKNAITREQAARAAAMSQCRFPLDFTAGMSVELPHLAQVRSLTRLMGLSAVFAAEKGDTERVHADLLVALKLRELIKEEPLLISQLVRIACGHIASQCVERAVNCAKLPDAQLGELQQVAAALEDPDLYYRALVGERCLASDELSKPFSSRSSPGENDFPKDLYTPESRRALIDFIGKLIEDSRPPYPARHTKITAQFDTLRTAKEPIAQIVDQFASALGRAHIAHDSDTAVIRVLVCGIAVKRYQAENKALPATLHALVPKYLSEVPEDPFDGVPLRYKRAELSATVYSVGRDNDDDGGEPFVADGTATPQGDITFQCY